MLTMTTLGGTLSLQGTGEIENLQRALTNLAIATNRPAVNPGAVTGTVNDATMTAISAGLGLLTEELPSYVYLPLQAAMMVGATSEAGKKYVGQYATVLTVAANTAAVKYKVTPPPPVIAVPTGGFFANLFAPGWYKTPFGMVLIGLGLLVGYKKFLAK